MKHRQPTTIIRTLATLSLFASFTGYSSAELNVATDYDFSISGTPTGGTLQGDATISGGKLNLDGTGDYLSFASTNLTALDNFVVEAIFNATAYTSGGFNFMVYNGVSTGTNRNKAGQGILHEKGTLDGILPSKGIQGTTVTATTGTDIALALVHNGGTSTVYVNGVAQTTANAALDPTIAANMLSIGAGFSNLGAAEGFFNGTIDRVRLSTFTPGTFSSADLLGPNDGTIPAGTDYAAWISSPGFGLDPGDRGFTADPDGDGLDNGVEAWFGTNPAVSNGGLKEVSKSGGLLTFHHPESDSPPTDVTGSYQWSLDLVTWNAPGTVGDTAVTISATPNNPAAGTTKVVADTTGSAVTPAQLFLRAVAKTM